MIHLQRCHFTHSRNSLVAGDYGGYLRSEDKLQELISADWCEENLVSKGGIKETLIQSKAVNRLAIFRSSQYYCPFFLFLPKFICAGRLA